MAQVCISRLISCHFPTILNFFQLFECAKFALMVNSYSILLLNFTSFVKLYSLKYL